MTLAALETSIVTQINFENKTDYKRKDIMEWSTSREKVESGIKPGEAIFHVKSLGVWCAMKNKTKKAKA